MGYILEVLRNRGLVGEEKPKLARGVNPFASEDEVPDSAIIDHLLLSGVLSEEDFALILKEEFGLERVDLGNLEIADEAIDLIGWERAVEMGVLPIEVDDNSLKIAISDPFDTESIDSLSHLTGRTVTACFATAEEISHAFSRANGGGLRSSGDPEVGFEEEQRILASRDRLVIPEGPDGEEVIEEAPIAVFVHKLIEHALGCRASDIHLEPLEGAFRVRYRVDGELMVIDNPPIRLQAAVISRLKLMAEMSIAEKRRPQEGRFQFRNGDQAVDLRVSCIPTSRGESIVMRVLDRGGPRIGIRELGFQEDDQAEFENLVSLPDGILLATGPTGSGKSTTLYACLEHMNQPDCKIITVEDPVEYELRGVNQVQVRREVGMTFSSAFRAILRQAPNVILVGEIRDRETAEIAFQASLTGHLIFSTLHTNDAPGSVSRLVNMGIEPFLVSASLRAAISQRLVRKICTECRRSYWPSKREIDEIGFVTTEAGRVRLAKGEGCAHCMGSGFYGRVGIFEIFVVTERLQSMIYNGASAVELRRRACQMGMKTLREDGIRKAVKGIVSLSEVLAITSEVQFD